MSTNNSKKKVIVIGAGFAGYNAVRVLEKSNRFSITLIDRENHNLFQPMLYQVATGLIPIVSVAVPIRYLINKSTKFIQGEVSDIEFQHKIIHLNQKKLSFDYLIICAGSKYQYFNTDWKKYTHSLKTASDAISMKDHILNSFEQAEIESDPDQKKKLLSFCIIGGGATGVEICGSITDLIDTKLIQHFHNISRDEITISLIEAGDRLLSSFSDRSSHIAFHDLSKKGGDIKLSEKVVSITSGLVKTSKAVYSANTIIWCVSLVSSLNHIIDESYTDHSGRIIVDEFLSMRAFPDVYCLGDASRAVDENNEPYPGLASVAKQQGVYAARDIIDRVKKNKRMKFHFKDYGSMAVISNHSAIAEFKKFYCHGRLGWYLWGFVHIYFLVNIKNKFSVFFSWMSYYFFKRPSSLIILNKAYNQNSKANDRKTD